MLMNEVEVGTSGSDASLGRGQLELFISERSSGSWREVEKGRGRAENRSGYIKYRGRVRQSKAEAASVPLHKQQAVVAWAVTRRFGGGKHESMMTPTSNQSWRRL